MKIHASEFRESHQIAHVVVQKLICDRFVEIPEFYFGVNWTPDFNIKKNFHVREKTPKSSQLWMLDHQMACVVVQQIARDSATFVKIPPFSFGVIWTRDVRTNLDRFLATLNEWIFRVFCPPLLSDWTLSHLFDHTSTTEYFFFYNCCLFVCFIEQLNFWEQDLQQILLTDSS